MKREKIGPMNLKWDTESIGETIGKSPTDEEKKCLRSFVKQIKGNSVKCLFVRLGRKAVLIGKCNHILLIDRTRKDQGTVIGMARDVLDGG